MSDRPTIVIGSYLEPELAARIAAAPSAGAVIYEPDLLPVPRYQCDHTGSARPLSAAELERWRSLTARADGTDVLVLCCPLTPKTEGLIGRRQLGLLPPHAVLVNVSRGPVVDQDALTAALAAGRLGGACLDVSTPEPLPAESPLWEMGNVLISPHSASTVAAENARLTELFLGNLERFASGSPLRNRYEPERGY